MGKRAKKNRDDEEVYVYDCMRVGEKMAALYRRKRREPYIIAAVIVLITALLIYGNCSLQTTVYEIPLPVEYAELNGFTIVQISDLHNARFGKEQSRLLQRIEEQQPDMIVVTGDLVDSNHTNAEVAMDFIKGATEIAPVYYVTGNHEGWLGDSYTVLEQEMEAAGVMVLNNALVQEEYNNTAITIAGVNDPDMPGNNIVKTKTAIADLMKDAEGYTVLLSHRPELYNTYVKSDTDLVFSGHYHGGQFRIPFIGGVIAPGAGFFPEYAEGTFEQEGTTMVVSRGLGNSVIPLRINNRPEIVVVKLTAE